jgi:hypothetical protein
MLGRHPFEKEGHTMSTHPLSFAFRASVAIAALILMAGTSRVADARDTILFLSGPAGTPCAQDLNVVFTSPSVPTPQAAIVGTGAPADPCFVEDDLGQPGKSKCITTTNSSDARATFTVQFTLPANCSNIDLDMMVKVDDVGDLYLNGFEISGMMCKPPNGPQLVYHLTYHDDFLHHFVAGTNTLTFFVYNNPGACALVGVGRSDANDGMNLQFEGTVSYDKPPSGGGLNLGWDDCGGLPATGNKTFACDTNAGFNTLIGSFVAPSFVTQMTSNEVVMDLESAGVTLPAWWNMRSQFGCRPTSLSANFDFTAGPFTCYDYWQGAAVGGITMDSPVGNRTRIRAVCALAAGDPHIGGILEGTEVYSFKARINNLKTVGPGSCAGCATGVCIVLQSIKIQQPVDNPYGGKYIGSPATRAFATWQGGIGSNCYAATPAKNVTWGSIKAQYH